MKNLNAWLIAKGLSEAQINDLDAEKQSEYLAEYLAETAEKMQEAVNSGATKEELKEMQDEIAKSMAERSAKTEEILKAQGKTIKSLLEKLTSGESNNTEKSVLDHLNENKETLAKLKAGEQVKVQFVTKAPGTMGLGTNVTGQVPQALRIEGVNNVASRRVRLFDVVTMGTIDSNLVEWVYQANKDGAAGVTAEGAAKNQIDFDLVVASQKVEKVTAYIKVTEEMLGDPSFMASEINGELTREVLKAAETQSFTGTGVSPQLNGIVTTASSFTAGSFATSIDNANEVDVLTVAMNQIIEAEHDPASHIFMHPADVTALKMVKVSSTDKRYVERLAMVAGELSLDGTPIIPTTLVTQGEYIVGDFALANVLVKDGLRIDIGYDSDDFTKNLRTIRAEWRAVVFVKNNDRTAFVKGDFATDKAALETP